MSTLRKFWQKAYTNKIEFVEQDPSKQKVNKSTKKSTPPDGRKRRQQVYEAQKRHRDRNDAYIGSLEMEVSRLQHLTTLVANEKAILAHQNQAMQDVLAQQPLHVQLDALDFDAPVRSPVTLGGASLDIRHDARVAHAHTFLDCDDVLCTPSTTTSATTSGATTGDSLAALNFILALEWPCKDHIKHININPPPEKPTEQAGDEYNGHALTTTHAVFQSALPSHETSEPMRHDDKGAQESNSGKWYLPHSEIDRLVELSGRLDLDDDQVTPAQAYAIARSRVPSQDSLRPVLEALVGSLGKFATCCGFGTVLPEGLFQQELLALLPNSIASESC